MNPKHMRHPVTRELLDCGATSCRFAEKKAGMRNNGLCQCLENLYYEGATKTRASIVSWLRFYADRIDRERACSPGAVGAVLYRKYFAEAIERGEDLKR